jgi:UDP-N-acetylmuramoyl-tripeptide--D-alanyl-D-alanine ligase
MLELGEKTDEEHSRILNLIISSKIENVILVGPVFSKIAKKSAFPLFQDVNKLIDFLKTDHISGRTILVKGSRGTGLEKIYDLL